MGGEPAGMPTDTPWQGDACSLVDAFRAGDRSPVEELEATLAAIEDRLVTDSLVLRYDPHAFGDGVTAGDGEDGDGDHPVGEGTFSLCSFWYVEALTRAGRLADARLALEKMFTYANHLGQYAEQVGLNGEQLGNFPQGFTHLGLISAAINLDRSLDA